MMIHLMHSQGMTRPGSFSTDITGMRDASDVLGFDVANNKSLGSFVAAHVASDNLSFYVINFFCEVYHGVDLVVKTFQVYADTCIHCFCYYVLLITS